MMSTTYIQPQGVREESEKIEGNTSSEDVLVKKPSSKTLEEALNETVDKFASIL